MPPKSKKTVSSDDQSLPQLMEGISSMHSWIKANTMIRPTKLGKTRGGGTEGGQDGSDDEDDTVVLSLTSRDPTLPRTEVKWHFEERVFKPLELKETMIMHLELDCKIIFAESKEAVEQIAVYGIPALEQETEEEAEVRREKISRCKMTVEMEREKRKEEKAEPEEEEDQGKMNKNNQFAFIERSTQTKLREMVETVSQTDPPPVAVYSAAVSPSILYDFFTVKEKMNEESSEQNLSVAEVTDDKNLVEKKLIISAKIVERLINLNTFDDIARDYRFYEDPSDELAGPEGSFLPLWQFVFPSAQGLEVTGLQWNHRYKDLFAVSYGSFDFYRQPGLGYLCLFSLKNPSYPEYLCRTHCGVMCLDIHPKHTHMIAAGLYDGNVAVFNLRSKEPRASYMSCPTNGKHRDVAWQVGWGHHPHHHQYHHHHYHHHNHHYHHHHQVRWGPDNLDSYLNFFSISGDGRVTSWTLVKSALWCTDKLLLDFCRPLKECEEMEEHLHEGARAIAFKPDDAHLFLVGTEEGGIYLATTEFSSSHLMSYSAYTTPVNSLMWNTFEPTIFISCAAELVVHVWHMDSSAPVMRFDLGSQVGDVAWAPYSSTVFSAVTGEGKVTGILHLFCTGNSWIVHWSVLPVMSILVTVTNWTMWIRIFVKFRHFVMLF